ncbi:hypothetical protein WJX81_008218 [Elliptochloris bilobata]|uniref:Histone deacetylase complex subunit SAP30 Sin3 binding domain-containing protein n=1 Tax=Elliptochloris bilobata TaxID=381761 RepID=A0AAW1QMK9_9CHLO
MTPGISQAPLHADVGEWGVEEDNEALLAKHTQVRVIGNNRTRAGVVGLVGVVKRAVGLGGWHWLQLSTGEEVRLQRNALVVLALPQGDELNASEPEEGGNLARPQGGAVPQLRVKRQRPLERASSGDNPCERRLTRHNGPRVDFGQLHPNSLKRYQRYYGEELPDVGPMASKDQLVAAVGRHFMRQVVDEPLVIANFFSAAQGGLHSDKAEQLY